MIPLLRLVVFVLEEAPREQQAARCRANKDEGGWFRSWRRGATRKQRWRQNQARQPQHRSQRWFHVLLL